MRGLRFLPWIAFAAFFAMILFSSSGDWDQMYSFSEVDRRSWMEGHPPTWSYQFCGGITRIGDPQSFGHSPLFLLVLIFGSVWGLKIWTLAFVFFGYIYLKRLLALFYTERKNAVVLECLSLGFIFSNYFLWHFSNGHFTWSHFYLAIAIIYHLLRPLLKGFRRQDGLLLASYSAVFFLGTFYHALMFFLLPVGLALSATAIIVAILKPTSWRIKNVSPLAFCKAGLFVILGGLGASYRILAVYQYQNLHPRVVDNGPEVSSLGKILLYQLLPSWNSKLLGFFTLKEYWEFHEYSAFNLMAWLVILCLPISAFMKRGKSQDLRTPLIYLTSLLVVGLLFAIGDASHYTLFSLLKTMTQNSLRVVSRYHVVFTFFFACAAAFLLNTFPKIQKFFQTWIALPWMMLLLLNIFAFRRISDFKFDLPNFKVAAVSRMTELNYLGGMYYPLSQGQGIIDCYNPLSREIVWKPVDTQSTRYPLVAADSQTPRSCVDRSYFRQDKIVLDPSCGPGTCVNITGLNPRESGRFVFRTDRQRYCLR
jgi:hypothetical protein